MFENNKKNEVVFFYEKMFVQIKDDRDSVTRLKGENWKLKNEKIKLG